MTALTPRAAWILLPLLAAFAAAPAQAEVADPPPQDLARHRTEAEDTAAIRRLLAAYTVAVTNKDRAAFEALLLDLDVPFTGVGDQPRRSGRNGYDTHRYADFRAGVFDDPTRFQQHFYNVSIKQDGTLAQVDLDFVTKGATARDSGYGWKTLQLLKTDKGWRIASEFYTGRALAG